MNKTKVIFRTKYPERGGETVAVFPALAGDSSLRTCLFYTHFGQHGTITTDYHLFTFPARPEEYASLKAELESIGYDLRIAHRQNRADYQARLKQVRAIVFYKSKFTNSDNHETVEGRNGNGWTMNKLHIRTGLKSHTIILDLPGIKTRLTLTG